MGDGCRLDELLLRQMNPFGIKRRTVISGTKKRTSTSSLSTSFTTEPDDIFDPGLDNDSECSLVIMSDSNYGDIETHDNPMLTEIATQCPSRSESYLPCVSTTSHAGRSYNTMPSQNVPTSGVFRPTRHSPIKHHAIPLPTFNSGFTYNAAVRHTDPEYFIQGLKARIPNNIVVKVFDQQFYNCLDPVQQQEFLKCLGSGIENPHHSSMGCYANDPTDYDRFKPFFCKALAEYHGVSEDAQHVSDWTLPEGEAYNVEPLGLGGGVTMRIRVSRNLVDFPLTPAMTREQRCDLENQLCGAFQQLTRINEYGGQYYSFTPGHPHFIPADEYQTLTATAGIFMDVAGDSYLASAGIAGDWPYGRGCYVSEDKGFIIWVGEEDHLRLVCLQRVFSMALVFNRVKVALGLITHSPGIRLAESPQFGNITSNPTNLGTGMRASVHLHLPQLYPTAATGETDRCSGGSGTGSNDGGGGRVGGGGGDD